MHRGYVYLRNYGISFKIANGATPAARISPGGGDPESELETHLADGGLEEQHVLFYMYHDEPDWNDMSQTGCHLLI